MAAKLNRINPKQAFAMKDCAFIDIRSSMEFLFVGHPTRFVNIAWIDEPKWEINQNFAQEVENLVQKKFKDNVKKTPIILICRSGVRSIDAGIVLLENGFTDVYSVDEGFEGDIDDNSQRGNLGGWRYHGLPWVQC